MARKRGNKTLFKKKTGKLAALIFAVLLSGFFAKENAVKEYAAPVIGTVSGKVVKVNDGDTVTVLNSDNKLVKIRLYGIDSPEKRQTYGDVSRDFLADRIYGKYVTADIIDIDRYDRSVGRIFIDETDINRIMVEEGQAWVYTQYCKIPEKDEWIRLQESAKADKKGLWNSADPVPPWEWRKKK